jgi:hypothetical protein
MAAQTHGTDPSRGTSLVKVGGALGVAGAMIGMAIFVGGCFGFGAAFSLSLIPTILGTLALVLVLLGGWVQRSAGVSDPQALAAVCIGAAVLVGGLLEVCVWLGQPIFASASGI